MDIERIVLTTLQSLDLEIVYLFGSAAAGEMRDDSDVDIAFLSNTSYDPMDIFLLGQEIATQVGREVDLVQLRDSSTVFQKEVIFKGDVLWQKSQFITDQFEMVVMKKYQRLNEERAGILEVIREEVDRG